MRRRKYHVSLLPIVFVLVLLVVAVFILQPSESNSAPKLRPTHLQPADDDVQAREARRIIDQAGEAYRKDPHPVRSLGRRMIDDLATSAAALYEMERGVLDENRPLLLRLALFQKIAATDDDLARKFVIDLLLDPRQKDVLRNQAVRLVGRLRTPAAFAALEKLYQESNDFPPRHILVAQMAETGDRRALPILLSALGAGNPLNVRSHAVRGLGEFAGDADVRDRLREIVLGDFPGPMRLNALAALDRHPGKDVDEFLKQVAGKKDLSAEVRATAEQLLKVRDQKP